MQLSKKPLGIAVIELQFKKAEANVVETLCPKIKGSVPDILVHPLNIEEKLFTAILFTNIFVGIEIRPVQF